MQLHVIYTRNRDTNCWLFCWKSASRTSRQQRQQKWPDLKKVVSVSLVLTLSLQTTLLMWHRVLRRYYARATRCLSSCHKWLPYLFLCIKSKLFILKLSETKELRFDEQIEVTSLRERTLFWQGVWLARLPAGGFPFISVGKRRLFKEKKYVREGPRFEKRFCLPIGSKLKTVLTNLWLLSWVTPGHL